MDRHLPFEPLPAGTAEKAGKRFLFFGKLVLKLFPTLKRQMETIEQDIEPELYMARVIVTSLIYTLFTLMLVSIIFILGPTGVSAGRYILMTLVIVFPVFTALLSFSPIRTAGKRRRDIEAELLFGLREMLIHTSAGIPLHQSIRIIAESGYGELSKEMDIVGTSVSAGMQMEAALKEMAFRTGSENIRRAVDQLVNGIKSGSSLRDSLRTIIDDIVAEQRSNIKTYTHSLNLLCLLYMLFAVALPTIGLVMMIVLSSFAGFHVDEPTLITFLVMCFLIQYILISFTQARRPHINT